jgi:hypothetical protein
MLYMCCNNFHITLFLDLSLDNNHNFSPISFHLYILVIFLFPLFSFVCFFSQMLLIVITFFYFHCSSLFWLCLSFCWHWTHVKECKFVVYLHHPMRLWPKNYTFSFLFIYFIYYNSGGGGKQFCHQNSTTDHCRVAETLLSTATWLLALSSVVFHQTYLIDVHL